MLRLSTPAFEPGDIIPVRYTCDGENASPPLRWDEVPEGTRAMALVVDDPDAPSGLFVHWLAANLPAAPAELPENVDVGSLQTGADAAAVEGVNDFERVGYGGPCPPRGHGPHRYQFRLYALNDVLELERGFTRDELARALEGHILEDVEIIGTYEREG